MSQHQPPIRADAQRNRDRVLSAAAQAFALDGLGVTVAEIARRAGVGTGTVGRHFPTKEYLFVAVLRDRISILLQAADNLSASRPPGPALFAFF